MDIKSKKILVTGADGFIGSHLTEELVKMGCQVRAMVFYNSFNSRGWLDSIPASIQNSIEFFPADIRDPYLAKQAAARCDVIFHLAALVAIPYSFQAFASYVDTNIKGTLNMLQAAREAGVEKFVHTSTSEVYGSAQQVPIGEEHPLHAQSPYAASKIGADQMALAFQRSFQLSVAVIRPFNTFGPRQSARAVIPTIIAQLAGDAQEISLGSLTPTRDFNYVDDTVQGFIEIARSEASTGETINIGSGFEISIGDTACLIAEIMGKPLKIKSDEQRIRPGNSEVDRLCADNRKARSLLKWEPRYSGCEGLRKGLAKTIEWFSRPENIKQYRAGVYNQ